MASASGLYLCSRNLGGGRGRGITLNLTSIAEITAHDDAENDGDRG